MMNRQIAICINLLLVGATFVAVATGDAAAVNEFLQALECIPFRHRMLSIDASVNTTLSVAVALPFGDVSWMASLLYPEGEGPVDLSCSDPTVAAVHLLYCQHLKEYGAVDPVLSSVLADAELSYTLCTEKERVQRRRLNMCFGLEGYDFYHRFVAPASAQKLQRMLCRYVAACGVGNFQSLCQIYLVPLKRCALGCPADAKVLRAQCRRRHPSCFPRLLSALRPRASAGKKEWLQGLWTNGTCPIAHCKYLPGGCTEQRSRVGVMHRSNGTNVRPIDFKAQSWHRRKMCSLEALSAALVDGGQKSSTISAEAEVDLEVEAYNRLGCGSSTGGPKDDDEFPDGSIQQDSLVFSL